jgi:hypothetical protein
VQFGVSVIRGRNPLEYRAHVWIIDGTSLCPAAVLLGKCALLFPAFAAAPVDTPSVVDADRKAGRDFLGPDGLHNLANRKAGMHTVVLGCRPRKKLSDALVADFDPSVLSQQPADLREPKGQSLSLDTPVIVGSRDSLDLVQKAMGRRRDGPASLWISDAPLRRILAAVASFVGERNGLDEPRGDSDICRSRLGIPRLLRSSARR